MNCRICGGETKYIFSFYCDKCERYFEDFIPYIKEAMSYYYNNIDKLNEFEEILNVYRRNIKKRIFSAFYEKKMFNIFLKEFKLLFEPILAGDECDVVNIIKIFKIITRVSHQSNLKLQESKEFYKTLSIVKMALSIDILGYFDKWLSFKISTYDFVKIIDRYRVVDNIESEICKLCKNHIKEHIISDYYIDDEEVKRIQLFEELSRYIDIKQSFLEDNYIQREYAKAETMTHVINKETYLIDNKVDVFGIPHYARVLYVLENSDCYKRSKKKSYKGNSMGVAIKLAKGIYIRPSTYNVEQVERESVNYIGEASLYISLKYIYIRGSYNIDIPIDKLLNLIPHLDAIEFVIDNRHNPVLIETDDAKYICSLVKYIKNYY